MSWGCKINSLNYIKIFYGCKVKQIFLFSILLLEIGYFTLDLNALKIHNQAEHSVLELTSPKFC